MRGLNLANKIFGRLTVINLFGQDNYKKLIWQCKCECGKLKNIKSDHLVRGVTKSCGCWLVDNPAHKTHGLTNTNFYKRYTNIKSRCENPRTIGYSLYGGRGIKCLWKSFEEFKDDMYEPYSKHVKEFGEKDTTIDRINNNGHYSKENCRWATRQENARNKRNNRLITHNGQTKLLTEWAEIYKIDMKKLHYRLTQSKMSFSIAILNRNLKKYPLTPAEKLSII